MRQITDILNFHFSSSDFKNRSVKVLPLAITNQLELRIGELISLKEKLGQSSFQFTDTKMIPGIFRKFKNSIKGSNVKFDNRELRTLTYSLSYSEIKDASIFSNENELKFALMLLDSKWKDYYLIGLIDCFMHNWDTKFRKSLELIEKFGANKLDSYKGSRTTLNNLKVHRRFLNTKNGDIILGDTVYKLNKPILKVTEILGVPESWITYPYFSKVIISYYESCNTKIINEIDNLNEAILVHNRPITNLRLLSKLIIQANKNHDSLLQEKIKKMAFLHIGDPNNITKWSPFDYATDAEKDEIILGRKILNEWITKQFIEVFFNVCINDSRRKQFWLSFASKISTFKVYGPLRTKNILKRDLNIAEIIDSRFESVISKKDVSAFILYIGNYMLIEFSNEGYAFYAYKITSPLKPELNHQLNSVDDLRNGRLPMAIHSDNYYDYFNEEGRITHRDGNQIWEARFNNWINNKVLE